jgi:hypothetical protein
MEKESENSILETTTAILIAVIVVIGALASWRASVIDDAAGDADYAGLRAAVFSVRAQALNNLNAYESYGNYINYERNSKLAGLLEEDLKAAPEDQQALLTEQMKVANDLADADRSLFETKYLNRDGSYSVQRQLSVMQADAARENDLDYLSQFNDADKGRARTRNMLLSVMVLSIATVFYAMVESVEGRTKFIMVGLGSLVAIAGIVMGAMVWFGLW